MGDPYLVGAILAGPARECLAAPPVVVGGRARAAHPRSPAGALLLPVVGERGVLFVAPRLAAVALDDDSLARPATDQQDEDRPRDRHCLQHAPRLFERRAGVEHLAEQMLR